MKVWNTEQFRKMWIIDEDENKDPNSCLEFFRFIHGYKPDIKAFLDGELALTGEYQIIYEIMQNADDAEADCLLVYYDEKYLLFANNGKPFDYEDVKSICNIGQSTKRRCDKIGRFGVGFKLVYRLVGCIDDVVDEYKAPIIFSWNNKDQIKELIEFDANKDIDADDIEYPKLFKLILTAIPVGVEESMIDLNGKRRVLFSKDKVIEVVKFINRNTNLKDQLLKFDQGSLFFIELKNFEEFKRHLGEQIEYIKTSLSFLNNLKSVIINNEVYKKPKNVTVMDFTVKRNSKEWYQLEKYLSNEQKKCDFPIVIAYSIDSVDFKQYPTLYKFLPISNEKHKLNFIIHSDFNIETSRRNIERGNPLNKLILMILKERLIEYLENNKNNEKSFVGIYYAILTSDQPDDVFVKDNLYSGLLNYIMNNIPIKDENRKFSVSKNRNKVVVKGTSLKVSPYDFGVDAFWFYYEDENAKSYAKNSRILNLREWCLKELIENGKSDKINEWIKKNIDQYFKFIEELNKIKNLDSIKKKLESEIKWLKFGDELLTVEEAKRLDYIVYNSKFLKNQNVKRYLEKLGTKFTDVDFKDYMDLFDKFFSEYRSIYRKIIDFINLKTDKLDELTFEERRELFLYLKERLKNVARKKEDRKSKTLRYICPNCHFEDDRFEKCNNCNFKFNRINDLRELILFKNKKGEFRSIKELLKPSDEHPYWLKDFEIVEYFDDDDLDKLLCKDYEVLQNVIVKEIERIVRSIDDYDLLDFYKKLNEYYENSKKYLKYDKIIEELENKRFVKDIHNRFSEPFKIVVPRNPKIREHLLKYGDYHVVNRLLENIKICGDEKCLPKKDLIDILASLPLYSELIQDFEINEENLVNKCFFEDEIRELLEILYCNNSRLFDEGYCLENQNNVFMFSICGKTVFFTKDEKLRNILYKHKDHFIEFSLKDWSIDKLEKLGVTVSRDSLLRKLLDLNLDFSDLEYLSDVVKESDKEIKKKFIEKILYSDILNNIKQKGYLDLKNIKYKFLRNLLVLAKDVGYLEYLRNVLTYNFIKLEDYILSEVDIKDYGDLDIDIRIIPKNVVEELKSIGLDENDLMKLFKDKLTNDDIYKRLYRKLNGKVIEKSSQLAFILKYTKDRKNLDILKNFKVKTKDGEHWLSEVLPLYLRDLPFIADKYILDTKFYKEIDEKLGLNESQLTFEVDSMVVILVEPYFDDSLFYCPWIKDNLDDNLRKDLLDFMYNMWKKMDIKGRIKIKPYFSDEEFDDEEVYYKLFGFRNPEMCVYPDEYACENERLPDWIKNWIETNEKTRKEDFLAQLGINTEKSLVVKIRKFFIKGEKDKMDISRVDNELLINTLIYLSCKSMSWNDKKIEVLKEIYGKLGNNLKNYIDKPIFIAYREYKEENKLKREYTFKSLKHDVVFLKDHRRYYELFKDRAWFVDDKLYPKKVLKSLKVWW